MTSPNPARSRVPGKLAGALLALSMLIGGGTFVAGSKPDEAALRDEYTQTVAADPATSAGVKVAMVMGSFYESSGRHIGKPYIDKLGKGQPLTVCNGITGKGVVAGRTYSPADCYVLERGRYLQSEREAAALLRHWQTYDPFVQGVFIDFVHNKGSGALAGSTMRAKANAGDLVGSCRENPLWNKGTVNGVRRVLPGLQIRGDANEELCTSWRMEQPA